MKYLSLLLSLVASASFAGVNLEWTNPTKRVDGTDANIQYVTLYWECNGVVGSKQIDAPGNSASVGDPPEGGSCTYWLTATDKNGKTSDESTKVVVEGTAAKPKAPYWTRQVISHFEAEYGDANPYWVTQLVWNLEAQFDGVRGL